MPRPCRSDWRTLRVDGLRRRRSSVRPRSNSKAVGGTQPTALPWPPYVPFSWTASLGCRDRASEGVANLSPVPSFRSKEEGRPRSDRGSLPPRVGSHRYLADIARYLTLTLCLFGEVPLSVGSCSTTEVTLRSPHELAIRSFGISHNPTRTQLFP
jgi:hypothetical protein